jgi:type II secretory pathway pseudopilin PulG
MRTLRLRLRSQAGYTLAELLVVMATLTIIMGGVTSVFVSGMRAEVDALERFDAQQNARLSLSYLRREVHCATAASISTTGSAPNQVQTMTLTMPTGCPTGTGSVSWCTVGSAARFKLYRKPGATCDATGRLHSDYLTTGLAFTYNAPTSTSLGTLAVDFPVDKTPNDAQRAYRLQDSLVLRNTTFA